MYYNVNCTYVRMYISDLKKNYLIFQKYSKLFSLPCHYAKESRASQYMSKDSNQKPWTSCHGRCIHLIQEDVGFSTQLAILYLLMSSVSQRCLGKAHRCWSTSAQPRIGCLGAS
jgi:hypothetical protein